MYLHIFNEYVLYSSFVTVSFSLCVGVSYDTLHARWNDFSVVGVRFVLVTYVAV